MVVGGQCVGTSAIGSIWCRSLSRGPEIDLSPAFLGTPPWHVMTAPWRACPAPDIHLDHQAYHTFPQDIFDPVILSSSKFLLLSMIFTQSVDHPHLHHSKSGQKQMRSFPSQGCAGAPLCILCWPPILLFCMAMAPRRAAEPTFAENHIALHCKNFPPPGVRRLCRHRRCLSASVWTPQAVAAIAHLTWEQLVGRRLSMGDSFAPLCVVQGALPIISRKVTERLVTLCTGGETCCDDKSDASEAGVLPQLMSDFTTTWIFCSTWNFPRCVEGIEQENISTS